MPLLIPVSVNYPSPLTRLPAKWRNDPVEGPAQISCEVDWATMGGNANCVVVNIAGNSPNPISQIVAVSVDNSSCGADVEFIFPDTGYTLTVPAYESGVFNVFSNGTLFYVSSPMAKSADVTRFVLHNTLPPPVSIPKSVFQAIAVNSNIFASSTNSVQLIPTTITGTIESFSVSQSFYSSAGGWALQFQLIDGAGNILCSLASYVGQAMSVSNELLTKDNVNIRFVNGLSAVVDVTTAPNNGAFSANVYYRTP